MKIRSLALVFAALLILGACAGAMPWNPQGNAGLTKTIIDVGLAKQGETPYIERVEFVDGKEKDGITISVKFVDGKPQVEYSAKGVKAFKAHELRAAVEMAVSADVKEAFPKVVNDIVDALLGL